jgi:Meiotically up-regulated gene 113
MDSSKNENVTEKSGELFPREFCIRPTTIVRSVATQEDEQPWLQPVWRDHTGEFYHAEFGLLYRTFARTLIHENVFWYVGQHRVSLTNPCGEYSSGFHFEDQLRHFIRDGFPEAQGAGTMELSETLTSGRKIYRVIIFCDDLYLCPKCGRYQPYRRWLPDFEWLRYDGTIDHDAIRNLIERRRSVPEFYLKPCGRSDCAELRKRTLDSMKEEEDSRSRVNALNALIKRDLTISNAFPIRRSAQAGFVYAIKADAYVKIGVAADVKNRILALRTGLPFEITIINTWKRSDATHAERALHRRFKSSRCSGEWFRLSDEDIQVLRRTERLEDLFDA